MIRKIRYLNKLFKSVVGMKLITECQYFPNITYYKYIGRSSHCILEQYERYQKMSFRNRCRISGGNGTIDLSIPLVEGRNQKTIMKDVRIANREPWQSRHLKTFTSSYNHSPWFEFYRDELQSLYGQKFEYLLEWNRACLEWTFQKLSIDIPISLTEEYVPIYDQDNWVDLRNRFMPKDIHQPIGEPVIYRQVFQDRLGFIPNLSIIDLLFCEGKNAYQLLR